MSRQSGCGCLKLPHPHLYFDLYPVNLCPQSVHHSLPVLHLCSGLEALHLLHTQVGQERGGNTTKHAWVTHTTRAQTRTTPMYRQTDTCTHTHVHTHTHTHTRTHTYRVSQLPVAHFEQCLQVHLAEVHPGDLPPIHIDLSFETHTLSS